MSTAIRRHEVWLITVTSQLLKLPALGIPEELRREIIGDLSRLITIGTGSETERALLAALCGKAQSLAANEHFQALAKIYDAVLWLWRLKAVPLADPAPEPPQGVADAWRELGTLVVNAQELERAEKALK